MSTFYGDGDAYINDFAAYIPDRDLLSNNLRGEGISRDTQSKYQGLDSQASSRCNVFLQCLPKRISKRCV